MRVRPCRFPMCDSLTADGWCDAHAAHRSRDRYIRDRHYDLYARNRESAKFYRSPEWQNLRRRKLAVNPVCQECNRRIAEHVHHVEPLKLAWERRLDWGNLQSLCQPCHNSVERSAA